MICGEHEAVENCIASLMDERRCFTIEDHHVGTKAHFQSTDWLGQGAGAAVDGGIIKVSADGGRIGAGEQGARR